MPLPNLKKYFLLSLFLISNLVIAQDDVRIGRSELVDAPNMQVELLSSAQSVAPGDTFTLALRMLPDADWHFYWENPGDTGLPTKIEWQDSQGLQYSELLWPTPSRADYLGFINYGYYGETLLLTEVTVPQDSPIGETLAIEAKADWLVCEEVCIPGRATLNLNLEVSDFTQASAWSGQISQAYEKIPEDLGRLAGGYRVDNGFFVAVELPQQFQSYRPIEFYPLTQNLVDNLPIPTFSADNNLSLIHI